MSRTETDYYEVLNVPRNATKEEITLAYRKLAVMLCPNRDASFECDMVPGFHENQNTHLAPMSKQRQWEYINMAYDVLGKELHREIYDRFGESVLFQGCYLPNGYFPPYQYDGNHMKVYREVFGSFSPFSNLIDVVTSPPVLYASNEFGIGMSLRDEPIEKVVFLTLEEVYNGCSKLMHVWRQEFVDQTNSHTEKRKVSLKLKIPPGVTSGTRFSFKEAGDRQPARIPADIIFITADHPHKVFERSKLHNLVYTKEISLSQALTGLRFTIPMLDKRKLSVNIVDVITPEYEKIIHKEGLPKCQNKNLDLALYPTIEGYGDLIVKFKIKFPLIMNKEMKIRTSNFFRELDDMERELSEHEDAVSIGNHSNPQTK